MEPTIQLPITYRDYTIDHAEPASRAKYQYIHKEYDGDGDNRWGTANTIEECKLNIEIWFLLKSIDDETTAKLEGSIQIENLKKDLANMNNMLTNREATIEVLTGFVRNAIKTFEEKFESDENAFNYEQMDAYKDMKAYMLAKDGKPSSSKLRQVLSRMNNLAA